MLCVTVIADSIHYLSPILCRVVGGWSLSQLGQPWTGRHFITGLTYRETNNHSPCRSHLQAIESKQLTQHACLWGGKPEHLEVTHADM